MICSIIRNVADMNIIFALLNALHLFYKNTLIRSTYFLVLLYSLLPILAFAQPAPCDVNNPEMTPTCIEACIICDIDGFTGRHESSIEGSLPMDFCTVFVHNAQWIAFQAASTNLEIELSVNNCDMGNGLELAIYKSLDCNTFEMISNCFGGSNGNPIPEGSSGVVENTEPLVVGQFYYLAMDGNFGDNCDWEFRVLEGSTEVSPLTETAPIEGEAAFCPNVLQTFTTDPEEGAIIFDWTLDGQSIGDNTIPMVELNLDDPGVYELCVTAKNSCDEATGTCRLIEVFTIPPTEIFEFFCENDCFEIDGNTFCETGIYELNFQLPNGCDSILILNLTEMVQPVSDLSFNICEGDTIFVGTTPYLSLIHI